jgi:hypothetical protein
VLAGESMSKRRKKHIYPEFRKAAFEAPHLYFALSLYAVRLVQAGLAGLSERGGHVHRD